MPKWVYFFGDDKAEGTAQMRELLGGKGANLAEMTRLGIPVPAGLTISTEACTYYYEHDGQVPPDLETQVREALTKVEEVMGARFGVAEAPLLLSVRSGARVSMPGMMDTVLNIGMNDETIGGFIRQGGSERAAFDSYRRLIQMYGNVVLGVSAERFEEALTERKRVRGVALDTELGVADLRELVGEFKRIVLEETGRAFPETPDEQLWGAIAAVFRSWNTPRAVSYRKIHGYPDDWGTAVNVQSMVFGNMGEDSATGVAFSRDPSTGEKRFTGEYLKNAQGEDVVAGIRTPESIEAGQGSSVALEDEMPESYRELASIGERLERHYGDIQDIEFTIQRGRLWMLQTRSAKRTGTAAVRAAVAMVREGLIDRERAQLLVEPDSLNQMLLPVFDPGASKTVLAQGLAGSPGAATGEVAFTPERAEERAAEGHPVILVRIETSPEDIRGMAAARGILTSTGGASSHAVLVTRGMGKACVAGCSAIAIDYNEGRFEADGRVVTEGEFISIDGSTGEVMLGEVAMRDPQLPEEFHEMLRWADETRRLRIRANADTPDDARQAREFGAEGIGLARTEHMFFEGDRIDAMREMILATDEAGRRRALETLVPIQRGDFVDLFRVMAGYPVTIRLLDPPLHEFLPHELDGQRAVAKRLGVAVKEVVGRVAALREVNPMLGWRGCRLGIIYPEIYEAQARAIFEAACEVAAGGDQVYPEVMLPLVGASEEFHRLRERIDAIAHEIMGGVGTTVPYMVGTMVELPRACLVADEIARHAEFLSFGTNDLTQMVYGFSRDDAAKSFLGPYVEQSILSHDPFARLDLSGVGQLMRLAVDKARGSHGDVKCGICGEHGGDPSSIEFCDELDLDYVSCSPFRIPIARLAAAQAAIRRREA